ncbi:S8 family serine peptidase [Streptomyces sp. NPDC059893]|uniref:S8 family serine peptidase n=1 Tax=Streptomyces sp. NPDC059893 TaxID=3346990 RepID=UPI00364B9A00
MKSTSKRPAFGAFVGLSMLLVAATPSASLALAGSTSTAPASPSHPGSPLASTPDTDDSRPGAAQRWIPLITGDRILVNGKGDVLSVRPAKGRENIPLRVETVGGHTYAIPRDARNLVESGHLDRRLFDMTTQSASAYAQRTDLRLIVMYDGARPAARTALRTTGGAAVQRRLTSIDADAISAPANGTSVLWSALTDSSAHAAGRTAAPGIASIWLDAVVQASLDKSVPQIGGPEAWAAGYDGTGTRIAVLDTGIDTTHPDLAGKVAAEHNFSDSPTTDDRFGHGTHVASIAAGTGAKSAGKYKGVAPGARLLDAKVLGDSGQGGMSEIIAGMEWAVAQNADVANLSLGAYDSPETDPMEEAVDRLSAQSKTLFVVAAGNNGELGAKTISTPGSAQAALTVGAVDKQEVLAPFSSTGPRVGDDGIKPDLTAPGVDIGAAAAHDSFMAGAATPVADGYIALSGTSMATPHVAGAAALLAQQHPDWSGDDIKQALVASTTPGAYTVFEQGSGRVDLRKAIKQSVFTKQTSLAFGLARWPHTDDEALTRHLTYHNAGDTPITLKLTVDATAPDESPAPSGMFSADDQVTVPAHGEASVKVTADTRPGGDTAGRFTGRITASGEGQSVATALAVERESEMYTVTVKPLDRAGKPAPVAAWDATLAGLSGPLKGGASYLSADTYTVRVPKGRYYLNASLRVDPTGSYDQGEDWFNQPNLDVTEDTTVTLDARTTKPVKVTVPDGAAQQTFGFVRAGVDQEGRPGPTFLAFFDAAKELRTAHVGPDAADQDTLKQRIEAAFSTGAQGHDEYDAAYEPTGDRYVTGFQAHPRSHDFAEVRTELGAPGKDKTGFLSLAAMGGGSATVERPLPCTLTLHLLSPDSTWWLALYQKGADGHLDTVYNTTENTFKPGRSYRRVLNVGVFGPDLPEGAKLIRTGNTMDGSLPLFSDGAGNSNSNQTRVDAASTSLYRNGELVRRSPYPMDFFYPAASTEQADYRLNVSVERSTEADVSSSLTVDWTFSSAFTAKTTTLPISVIRFTPHLSLDNTGKAGAKVQVPVTVKGAAAGQNLRSLKVWVSHDKGTTWQTATVRDGRIQVTNPAAGGSVSFKTQAVDRQNNTVHQSIINAYLTK